ncbi:MAG: hypothetical protein QOH72_2154 [Solirubrobacteraceae bacterium]|nr:hypothetical protein [Solirubrobacteraceae bacterium]
MSHFLAARRSAAAHRGRAAALVGALALVIALFAMTAAAGATAHPTTGHAAKQGAGKQDHNGPGDKAPGKDEQAGKPKDKNAGGSAQPPCDSSGMGNPCQPPQQCGQNSGPGNANATCPAGNPECPAAGDQQAAKGAAYKAKGAEDTGHKGKKADAGNACEPKPQCDSSGPGNPCQPPQQCGRNSGPGNANATCPAGNPECPAAGDEGAGYQHDAGAAGYDAKGVHKAKDAKRKNHKDQNAGEHNDVAAGCPPPNQCEGGKVMKEDGTCVPVDQCRAPNVVKDGTCVPAEPCKAGEVMKDGTCVPANQCNAGEVMKDGTCVPANQCKPPYVVNNGACVPADKCVPPNTVVNGVCTPPDTPQCRPGQVVVGGQCVNPQPDSNGCTPPQVLQNGVCATPGTTVAGTAQQAPAATAPAPTTAPASNVAGTQARSATARLRAQTRCGTSTFRVTISGRSIRRITLFVAGRRVKTITVPAGRRSVTVSVPVRRFGARRQSVQARVTFRNGAAPRTLTASATRCAQTAVSPQFTG